MTMLTVEVVYALPDKVYQYTHQITEGTTLLDAVKQTPLLSACPNINIDTIPVGIFGKKVLRPPEHILEEGDRIELYRPITADPKTLRKQRAAKNS